MMQRETDVTWGAKLWTGLTFTTTVDRINLKTPSLNWLTPGRVPQRYSDKLTINKHSPFCINIHSPTVFFRVGLGGRR